MSVYAVSDLHGRKKLLDKILEILQPGDTLYCLGDVCDRGKYGYDMIKEVLANPQIVYLKGNHEELFIYAAKQARHNKFNPFDDMPETDDILFHRANGGEKTLRLWEKDGMPMDIIRQLEELPTAALYKNISGKTIVLTHSGSFTDPLWDREHFIKDEDIEENTIYVHGHTPIPYMINKKNTKYSAPYWYNNNQKVNIDCGSFASHMTVLLNLDTFGIIPIYEDEEKDIS